MLKRYPIAATALDVTIQTQVLDLLHDLRERLGTAMLLITHDLGVVRKMADRVCVMTQGEVVEAGSCEEIFERPAHAYPRKLLAAVPKGGPLPVKGEASTLGLTYVFISHDLKVIRALAHDLVVMRAGTIVEQGPAERLLDNPDNDYTRELVSAALKLQARAPR